MTSFCSNSVVRSRPRHPGIWTWFALLMAIWLAGAGCSDSKPTAQAPSPTSSPTPSPAGSTPATPASPPASSSKAAGTTKSARDVTSPRTTPDSVPSGAGNLFEAPPVEAQPETVEQPAPRERPQRSLSELLLELEQGDGDPDDPNDPADPAAVDPQRIPPLSAGRLVRLPLDDAKLRNFGVRKLTGEHLTLYTDVESSVEVDELPVVFDEAIADWQEYFEVPEGRLSDWHLTGFLIRDKEKFKALGLLPAALPPFLNGYHAGDQVWIYEQPTAYYRRHLLLHEGTHGIMQHLYGGGGPPWYMEGVAELLGTHAWDRDAAAGQRLQLNYFPQAQTETPHWGRIRIVQEDFAAHKGMSLPAILLYPPNAHLQNEPYGWCWAAAAFLDGHPDYRAAFRDMPDKVLRPDFNQQFFEQNQERWWKIELEWQLFVSRADYGYDIAAEVVDFKPGTSLEPRDGRTVETQVGRGWQSTGIRVEAGTKYRLKSDGRYQIAREGDQVWWSEPNGVTLRYYRGYPLGMVLAAVHPDGENPKELAMLAWPVSVGLDYTLEFPHGGTLYLRANDSPAELDDNAGTFQTRVMSVASP